ncbi:YigZ family protein [Tigheibacillus jepli]
MNQSSLYGQLFPTRYFGGIKLGAGGLIRAYSTTASQAIKTTGIVKGS